MLVPAMLSCAVPTNGPRLTGVLMIVTIENATFQQASNRGQETQVMWPTKF